MVRPPPDFSSLKITHERGPVTRQVRTAALAWGGDAAWADILAAVSPACRARFARPIGFYEWVESELALELHAAWAAHQGVDDMSQRGEDGARELLGGVQQWILRLASPAFLIENVPKLYGFYYRGGCMNLAYLGPGKAGLEFNAMGYPESWFRDGLTAWLRVALALTGTQEVRVNHVPPNTPETPYLHRYEIAWRV